MRTRWLSLLLSVPVLALALQIPLATAPHEASACSGAVGVYPRDRDNARVQTPTEVATDTLVLVTDQIVGVPASTSSTPKLTGYVEDGAGSVLPLSRNDLLQPVARLAFGPVSAVLRPQQPFAPDTDYFLVLADLSPSDPAAPTTQRIAFHTGDGPRPLPPAPEVTESGPAEKRGDVATRDSYCCLAHGLGSCTQSACVPRHYLSREIHRLAWPGAAGVERWGVEVEGGRAADEEGWTTVGAGRSRETSERTVEVFLAAGEAACARVFAIDPLTGDRSASEPHCWTAGTDLPPPRDPCGDLTSFSNGVTILQRVSCQEGASAACAAWRASLPPAQGGASGSAGSGGSAGESGGRPAAGSGGSAGGSGASSPTPPPTPSDGCTAGGGAGSLRTPSALWVLGVVAAVVTARRGRKVALPTATRGPATVAFRRSARLRGGRRPARDGASSSGPPGRGHNAPSVCRTRATTSRSRFLAGRSLSTAGRGRRRSRR